MQVLVDGCASPWNPLARNPVFLNLPEAAPLKLQTLSVTPSTLSLEDIENLTAYAISLNRRE